MAVDDSCNTHSLVYLGSICIDFIMWSFSATILIEFGLGFFSGDHTYAYSILEVVSSGRSRVFLVGSLVALRGKTKSTLIYADATVASTLRPTGRVGGRVMPLHPFGLEAYKSLVVWWNSCRA